MNKGVCACRKLNTFDVTNLVVGSIIGADVYVVTAVGSKLIGPASIIIWLLAGIMATVIAISFSYCIMMSPRVGGPYAYVREVATPFSGFMVGWGLLLAEWLSLAVFPVAFVQYFVALIPGLDTIAQFALKAVFIAIILVTNIVGVKAAGRINDGLTIAKLLPLVLIILGGLTLLVAHPSVAASNFQPFFTGDAGTFAQALILIFWAYAGFEISTLPANDVDRPERTIPRAIVLGMLIVIAFYLLTNFVVIGVVSQSTLSASSSPLIDATSAIYSSPVELAASAVAIVGIGALLSITGSNESGTMGTSRLAYAMAIDGLLPRLFGEIHRKYNTPYLGLIVLCITAFAVSLFGGLAALISSSVFLLAFVYLATCISAVLLQKQHGEVASRLRWGRAIPIFGAIFCIILLVLVDPVEIVISLALLAIGVPIYLLFSPKEELTDVRRRYWSEDAVLRRACHQGKMFLAFPLQKIKMAYYKRTRQSSALKCESKEECGENMQCKPI